jgi:1-acyl-sn-glycerol-3-phosphate acyltransferase
MWLSLLVSLLLFLPFPLFQVPGLKRFQKKYVHFCTSKWAQLMLALSGSRIIVNGKENIPGTPPFAILSNHQGYMDIPILMSIFPYSLSFVAKRELLTVPIINFWLLALECLAIDRSRPHFSQKKIAVRIKKKDGNPIILFPEGTRSRGSVPGKWKKGGMKAVEDSGVPRIFVRIEGSYKIWEETGMIRPAEVTVTIFSKAEETRMKD